SSLPARVHVPAIHLTELLDDWCRPIARDGAATIEVGIRLQKALGALAGHAEDARPPIRREAQDAVERAKAALTSGADRAAIERAYASCFGEG
ncbi:DUF2254 domain-containing protein, partial [Escherichia coli]|nr:DUF2254 domain-containing protein [Escherichia coli]